MQKIRIILVLSIIAITISTYGAKAPIKYGKVNIEELQMTHYDKDSTAPAVVLCDYGVWSLQDYKFRKIVRIKILTTEGLDYANQVYLSDAGTSIRGKTYNLVNGEIEVTKLKAVSIFKERIIDDYYNWKVAMPNVKVGSVIDIEYSHWGIPTVWQFQKEIPVKWSELIIPESMYIQFRKSFFGYEQLSKSTPEHWIAENMPAFKAEPYVNSPENYITKFEFDVEKYTFPGFYREYTTDWNAVARRFNESDYFGTLFNAATYLYTEIQEIKEKDQTELGRMKLAFESAKKVKFNGIYSSQSSIQGLAMIWKKQIGNSADVNLILINLLRKLDLDVKPVVLSTRKNGVLPVFNPSINKLNHVIARVIIDEKEYLLDATDQYTPYNLLPEKCLNGKGQILTEKHAQAIDLNINSKETKQKMFMLELNNDLELEGNFSCTYRDYGALNFRNFYHSFNSDDDLLNSYIENHSDIDISNYEIANLNELEKPVQEKYNIKIHNQVQNIDSLYYLNPLMHLKTTSNPFKVEERKYPVDFAYGTIHKTIIQIAIPEGFSVKETPKPVVMALPNKAGKVIYQIQAVGNRISILYQYTISKPQFSVEEYGYLRGLYNEIIRIQAEPIVLKNL